MRANIHILVYYVLILVSFCLKSNLVDGLSKHGMYWGASAGIGSSISIPSKWLPIENTSMQINLETNRTALISYHITVDALKIIGGSPLPREENKDVLQVRCLINDIPYRFSSSFTSLYLIEDQSIAELSSSFAMNLTAGINTVALQWKKFGDQVSKWIIAGPIYGSGYSISVMADHDVVWYNHELNDVVLSIQGDWKRLTSSLTFNLAMDSNVIIGYSFAAQPQVGKFIKDSGLEYINSRVMVDDVSYAARSGIYGTSRWNPRTGIIHDAMQLKLSAGPHNLHLEWKKIGYAFQNWLSTPSVYDGFASSRNIYVMLEKFQTMSIVDHTRSILHGDGAWRTVANQMISFDLGRETAVYIIYGLPVTQYSNPNFDNYTWEHLSTVSTRLLVDNIPYTYASDTIGRMSRGIITSHGSLGLLLAPGSHAVALQWRADQGVNWMTLNQVEDGFFAADTLLVSSSLDNVQPIIIAPTNVTTLEDSRVSITSISVSDEDQVFLHETVVYVNISATIGYILFKEVPILANSSYTPSSLVRYFEIYDTITFINTILSSMVYVPVDQWSGSDSCMIYISDLGNLGYGGVKTAYTSFHIIVIAVDDPFILSAPQHLAVNHNQDTIIADMSLIDIDSYNSIFHVEAMVSCGYLSIDNASLSQNLSFIVGNGRKDSILIYEGLYMDAAQSLKSISYMSRSSCDSFQHNDILSFSVSNLDNLSQTKTVYTTILIDYPEPIISIEALTNPRWKLSGLSIVPGSSSDNINRSFSYQQYDPSERIVNISLSNTSYALELQSDDDFTLDSSSLSILSLNNNLSTFVLMMQFNNDRIGYAGSNQFHPIENSCITFHILSDISSSADIYCRLGKTLYHATLTSNNNTRTNNTIACNITSISSYHNIESIQAIWINVIAMNDDRIVFSSQYLPFYVIPLPKITDVAPTCLYSNTTNNIRLSVANPTGVRYCMINGVSIVPATLQPSSVVCQASWTSTSDNISIALLNMECDIISSAVNVQVYPLPAVESIHLQLINSREYITIHPTNTTQHCSNPDARCNVNDVYSSAALFMNGDYLCQKPSGIEINSTFQLSLNLGSLSLHLNASQLSRAQPTLVDMNITPSTARYQATINSTRIEGTGFTSIYPSYLFCNFINTNILVLASIISDCTIDCQGGSGSTFLRLVDSNNRSTGSVIITEYPQLHAIHPVFCYDTGIRCDILVHGSNFMGLSFLLSVYNIITDCEFLTVSTLSCPAPPHRVGSIAIEVYVDGLQAEILSQPVFLDYVSYPIIYTVSPLAILSETITNMEILGENFNRLSMNVSCIFEGWNSTAAVIVNDSMLYCTSPMVSTPSIITLTVSVSSHNHTSYLNPVFLRIIDDIMIQSITPAVGSVYGGSTVMITGENFFQASSCTCTFGTASAVAIVISTTIIECVTPEYNDTGSSSLLVDVSVILDGYKLSIPSEYEYSYPVMITSISSYGVVTSNYSLSIFGQGFLPDAVIMCIIGDYVTIEATYESYDRISCSLPTRQPGNVTINMYQNGIKAEFDDIPNTFEYVSPPPLLSLNPSVVLLSTVMDVITIIGERFNQASSSSIACKFNETSIPAILINDSHVLCPVQSISHAGVAAVSLLFDSLTNTFSSSNTLYVRFIEPFDITSINPAIINHVRRGSNATLLVSILGTNFIKSSKIGCLFDDIIAVGRFLNSTAITCYLPYIPISNQSFVQVSIMIDGIPSISLISLTYGDYPLITSIDRLFAVTVGGSIITINGGGFQSDTIIRCIFDHILVTASYLSSTQIQCLSPSLPEGTSKLSFYYDGQLITDEAGDSITYDFYSLSNPVAYSVSPRVGYVGEETPCIITYQGFEAPLQHDDHYKQPICKFGSVVVAGQYLNATAILCMSPPMPADNVVIVSVFLDELSHLPFYGYLDFRYVDRVIISSIIPTIISAITATDIIISGKFFQAESISCIYDTSLLSPGIYLNSTAISCLSPSHTDDIATVKVEVKLDGLMSDTSAMLSMIFPPTVSSMSHTVGPTSGGTHVVIIGQGFTSDSDICCYFNATRVIASFISSTSVKCIAPSSPIGLVNLIVMQDNIIAVHADNVYNHAVMSFEYTTSPILYSIDPVVGLVAGDSLITVTGRKLSHNHDDFDCLFNGSIHSPLIIVNDSIGICISPAVNYAGIILVQLFSKSSYTTIPGSSMFRYIEQAKLLRIEPAMISPLDTTPVIVTATYFYPSADILCHLGSDIQVHVPGIYINDTCIKCQMHNTHIDSINPYSIEVSVSIDGYYLGSSLQLSFKPPLILTSNTSFISSTIGGSILTIEGNGFPLDASTSVYCQFDNLIIQSQYISSNRISCTTPSHPSKTVQLKISQNNIMAKNLESNVFIGEVMFTDSPFISGISSSTGLVGGGSVVKIYGKRLDTYSNSTILCKFGDMTFAALEVTASYVTCITPSYHPSLIFISLTSLANDVFLGALSYHFVEEPVIFSIIPITGSTIGGTTVTIIGSYYPAMKFRCMFEGVGTSIGRYLNSTAIQCSLPPLVEPISLDVMVSLSLEDIISNSIMFTYIQPPSIINVSPSDAILFVGSTINVYGSGFENSAIILCAFNDTNTVAMHHSSDMISCKSPYDILGRVSLTIYHNNVYAVQASTSLRFSVVYELINRPVVRLISSAVGSIAGGEETYFTSSGLSYIATESLTCLYGNMSSVRATRINDTTFSCRCPPSLSPGRIKLTILHDKVILVEYGVMILDLNITYAVSSNLIPSSKQAIISITTSFIYDFSTYLCELKQSQIKQSALVYGNKLFCMIKADVDNLTSDMLQVTLDIYGVVYESIIYITSEPVITGAILSVANGRSYVAVRMSDPITYHNDWKCVFDSFQVKSSPLEEADDILVCDVSSYLRPTSVYLNHVGGILLSNKVHISTELDFLYAYDSYKQWSNHSSVSANKNPISPFIPKNKTFRMVRPDYLAHYAPYLLPRREPPADNMDYVPLTDASIIHKLFIPRSKRSPKTAISCSINHQFDCIQSRSSIIKRLLPVYPDMAYHRPGPSPFESSTSTSPSSSTLSMQSLHGKDLVIYDVDPMYIDINNSTWVTVSGTSFRNSTVCKVVDSMLLTTISNRRMLRCRVPSQGEIRYSGAVINLTLHDSVINFTSHNYFPLFYKVDELKSVHNISKPDLYETPASSIINNMNINTVSSQSLIPPLFDNMSYCRVLEGMLASNHSNAPSIRNKFILDKLSFFTDLHYQCPIVNITTRAIDIMKQQLPIKASSNESNSKPTPSVIWLSPRNFYVNQSSAISLFFHVSDVSISSNICVEVKHPLLNQTRCLVNKENIVSCSIPASSIHPGEYNIQLLLECQHMIFSSSVIIDVDPTINAATSSLISYREPVLVKKVEPLVSFWEKDYHIMVSGDNLGNLTHCRFMFMDDQGQVTHEVVTRASSNSQIIHICLFDSYHRVGSAELEIRSDDMSWTPTYFMIRFLDKPILSLAKDYSSFNATIIVFGELIPQAVSIYCIIGFTNNASMMIPGVRVGANQIHCVGFDSSTYSFLIETLAITINGVDELPVKLDRAIDQPKPQPNTTSLTNPTSTTRSNLRRSSSPIIITSTSRVCDEPSYITVELIPGAYDYTCQLVGYHASILDLPRSLSTKQVRCHLPSISPGSYLVTVNSNYLTLDMNILQAVNLTCFPRPKVLTAKLLPISVLDGSSTIQLSGHGFHGDVNASCIHNYVVTRVSVDSDYRAFCTIKSIAIDSCGLFKVVVGNITLYESPSICLSDSVLTYGISDLSEPSNLLSPTNDRQPKPKIPYDIISASSNIGLTTGGLAIEIIIDHVDIGTLYYCMFGSDRRVQATLLDFNKIVCISPPMRPGNVTLYVVNKLNQIWQGAWFMSYPPPVIYSSSPSFVTTNGGDIITMNISSLPRSPYITIYCYVGSYQVQASLLPNPSNPTTFRSMQCMMPIPLSASIVEVYIGSLYERWPISSKYKVISSNLLLSYYPKHGSYHGGGVVRIIINPTLASIPSLNCLFGSALSPTSTYNSNSSELICVTPKHNIGPSFLFLTNPSYRNSPQLMLGYYLFEEPFDIVDVSPRIAVVKKQTDFIITGVGFRDTSDLLCFFGNVIIHGKFLSSTKMVCTYAFPDVSKTSVRVSLSNNGVDRSARFVTVSVTGVKSIVKVAPLLGYSIGGTPITVHLIAATSNIGIYCKFGSALSNAYTVNESAIVCIQPQLPAGKYTISILDRNIIAWQGLYEAIAVPVVESPSSDPILANLVHKQFMYGGEFDYRTVGYISNKPCCYYVNASTLSCSINVSSSVKVAYLYLSVNQGVDFKQKVLSFQIVKPMRILSIHPTFLLSNGGVDIEMLTSSTSSIFPLTCGYTSIGLNEKSLAYHISNDRFLCRAPSSSLPIGSSVTLSLFQNNQIIADRTALKVTNSPLPLSISTSTIISGRLTPVFINFKEAFPAISLYCSIGTDRFTMTMIKDVTGKCIVQRNLPGRVSIHVEIDNYFNASIIFERDMNIMSIPDDTSVNQSAIVVGQPTTIIISSPSCMLPNAVNILCGSNANVMISTTFYDSCEVVCVISVIERSLSQVDLGLCLGSNAQACVDYELVDAIDVFKKSPILSIDPMSGPVGGNTSLVVYGYDYVGVLHCLFDHDIMVVADIISFTELVCHTPAHSPGVVSIQLMRQGIEVSLPALVSFEYKPLLSVRSVSPEIISALGQTTIRITLYEVDSYDHQFECRFDSIVVIAYMVEWAVIECLSPPLIRKTKMNIIIRMDGEEFTDPYPLSIADPPSIIFFDPQIVRLKQKSYSFTLMIEEDVSYSNRMLWKCLWDKASADLVFQGQDILCQVPGSIVSLGYHTVSFIFASAPYRNFPIQVYDNLIVQRIFPSSGFSSTNTLISLTLLSDIDKSVQYTRCCFGNGISSPTVRSSGNLYQCYASRIDTQVNHGKLISTKVGLMSSDSNCDDSGFLFTYVSDPIVLSVSKSWGYVVGGDVIDIMFLHDFLYGSIYCKIGEESFIGQLFGGNSVLCITRRSRPGKYMIELSVNNIDFIPTGYEFEFKALEPLAQALPVTSIRPIIDKIDPNLLSAGQTQTIRVYGQNFMFGAECVIGSQLSSKSVFISPMEMSCLSPIHGPGLDTILVRNLRGNLSEEHVINFIVAASLYVTPGSSVNPPFGPLHRPTMITVYGSNIDLIPTQVLCLISSTWVYAFDITSTSAKCITPTVTISGRVSVRLATINHDLIPGYGSFEYIDDPIVYSVFPTQGYTGTQVLLQGRGFQRISPLTCIFDDKAAKSYVLSDTSILCIAPTGLKIGTYSISLQTNGQYVLRTGVSFEYLRPTAISYMWPSHGPALRGSTIVTIIGNNFQNILDLYCMFGSSRVPAMVLSSTYIQCRTPPHIPGKVNVSILSSGTSLTNQSIEFLYTPDVSVSGIHPPSGFTSGGYMVFVFGSNFINSTSLACSFADMKSRGTFLSDKAILCLAPSPIGRPVLKNYDIVPVEVSNNGYDYSNSNVTFRYYQECDDGSYCLGSVSQLCPNGTYCNNNANNYTLCAPGYFQPQQGQSNCILCPIGYVCPDAGMSRPVVCPNGQICDTFGLRTSLKSCPNGFYCLNNTKASSAYDFVNANNRYDNLDAWQINRLTGAVYFNASVLNYSNTSWPYPAYGKSRVIHPPELQCNGYDCLPGSIDFLAEAPFPCPIGYYCRTGVGSQISIPKNFSTPQRCFDGYFCGRGSSSPEGSGPCPNGYFCPTPVDAIPCLVGHYCPGVGNTAPIECYPGSYNPYEGKANCSVCPSGFICPGWGSLLPEPCPAGFICMQLGLSFPVVLCPQGYYCSEGTRTLDPSDPTEFKPIPCPDRVFCLGGVASLTSVEWIATQPYGVNRPQLCSEGTYCESAAYLSSGSGLCFLGHYCPPNSSFPIATPIGNFASTLGSVAPTLCYPGTYAPLQAQTNCLPCPSGFTCQSYGTYQPTVCAAGTYRSQVDAVICIQCPQGTYGYEVGAPDISLCLPCPPTRVCGVFSMYNLNQSTNCASGYVCGHATQLSAQYAHKSPAGYYTGIDTDPSEQYNNRCESGYFCARGTPDYLSVVAKCSTKYFCPPATSSSSSVDNLCPQLTTSAIGSTGIQNCTIDQVNVCDKIDIEPFIPYQDVTYYSTFSYLSIDGSSTNSTFNSSLQSTATFRGEVQVVRKVMPINVTSSSSLWTNDTVEAFRSCPTYGSNIGSQVITIIGRNFINSSSNFCKFRSCISSNRGISLRRCRNQLTDQSGNPLPKAGLLSNVTYISPATYLSPTRMQCTVPAFVFDGIQFNPTIVKNFYTCDYLIAGAYSYNNTGNYSYIRQCDSSSSCKDLPSKGYEYFASLAIPCTANDISSSICAHRPEEGYFFNPCVSAEVLIEVSNDGQHFSGGDNTNGTFILSTIRFGDGNKIYRNFKNYTTIATFAEYTYVMSDYYYTNQDIVTMDTKLCMLARYAEESQREREEGWFRLHAHEAAHVQVNLTHLDGGSKFIYGQHYRIAVFVIPSRCEINLCSSTRIQLQPTEYLPCRYPRDFSNWFLNAPAKNLLNNLTVYALDDLLFKVEIHILYGLYAPYQHLFENSTTVRIQSPSRARTFTGVSDKQVQTRPLTPYVSYERQRIIEQYIFCAVYSFDSLTFMAQSLNMPPLYTDYERGRTLMMNNVSADNPLGTKYLDDFNIINNDNFWNQPATTVAESKELLDAYFETFHQTTYDPSSGYSFGLDNLLLPYLPFFSNCYTFDSYIPIWLLFEGKECILPDIYPRDWHRYNFPALVDADQIKVVGPFNFFELPVADWCERNLTCNYEEQLSATGGTSRWFEQPAATALFQLLRYPINYQQYTGRSSFDGPSEYDVGGATIVDSYATRSVDNFIPVLYDRSAGDVISNCSLNCFPRAYKLEVTYYQIDRNIKRIIYASLTGSSYDFNATNTEYQLQVSYYALGWLDLVLNFAFDYQVNSFLNVVIGLTLLIISGLIWLINRITTHLRSPPEFRFMGIYILFFPPILAGSILALIPIWILTAFGNYLIFGRFTTDPQNPKQEGIGLVMDSFPSTYNSLDYAISESSILALRNQRVGTMFCIIGFCCFVTASKLYFCKPETKRERDIAKLRTTLAHRVWQWQPVLWKKSNFIFTSYCLALLLTMLVEVSLWSEFSNYQFLCMTIILIIGVCFDRLFFLQMQDELLAAPLNAAYGFMGQFVTFGANNYLQFILSYIYGIVTAFFLRLYLDTYLKIFVMMGNWMLDATIRGMKFIIPRYIYDNSHFITKILKRRETEKVKRRFVNDAVNGDPSYIDLNPTPNGLSPTYDEQTESVEPLIGTYSTICNDMVIVCYFPYMIYLMMQYRVQTGIPSSYGIRQSDMVIYLVFQGFMVIFEPLYAVFNVATLELYRGWKCYDYLVYCRYRFLQRDSRWKGMEDSVDESIDESVRKLDQMCFSSQYFFMLTIMTNGIIYNIIAMEVWLHSPNGSPSLYSPFSDSGFLLFAIIMLCMWVCVEQGCYYLALVTNLWRVKHTNTSWHINYNDNEGLNLPEWGDIQGASHDAYLMNQRITSETFRHKFLNYNRTWLIHQLPQILTPRTMHHSRPALVNQLQRVINAYRQDISDESDNEGKGGRPTFGRMVLSSSSKNVVRWWLSKARRRMKLKKVVDPLIREARGYQCETCLSVIQLQVEYEIDIDRMTRLFDEEYAVNDDIDPAQWRNFWIKHQRYHTTCLACLAKRRDDLHPNDSQAYGYGIPSKPSKSSGGQDNYPAIGSAIDDNNDAPAYGRRQGFGPVTLTVASKAMLLNWYRKAQLQRSAKIGRKRKNKLLAEISDDEADNFRAPWASETLHLTPATTAIATRWLTQARAAVHMTSDHDEQGLLPAGGSNQGGAGAGGRGLVSVEGLLPGMRSRYMRK